MVDSDAFQSSAKLGLRSKHNAPPESELIDEDWASEQFATGAGGTTSPYIVVDTPEWKHALADYQRTRRRASSKETDHITIQAADNLIRATAWAEKINRPLRHHLIIRWPTDDWSLHQPVQQLIGRWLKRNVGGAFYVWAKEGNGGPHSHFLLHLGSMRAQKLRRVVIRGVCRLSGLRRLSKGTIRCRTVHSFGSAKLNTAYRAAYLCKGAGPQVRAFLGLDKSEVNQLRGGKRSGVSQSLGPTVRAQSK